MTAAIDLSPIYTTSEDTPASAGLRCREHPDWWADADGTALPDVIRAAQWHITHDHILTAGEPS